MKMNEKEMCFGSLVLTGDIDFGVRVESGDWKQRIQQNVALVDSDRRRPRAFAGFSRGRFYSLEGGAR